MPKTETTMENVFMCDCGAVLITKKGAAECCDLPMESAGWIESK
jgi:hypothetical protein